MEKQYSDAGHGEAMTLRVDADTAVSALLQAPAEAWAGYVCAHGAGAGMQHPFMAALARALAARGVATLRFQFPFVERGAHRPDPPELAQATVRAAVAAATARLPALPWFAGGKSFGGRMGSQAQAALPLPGVRGLVFAGFPLHPAGRPGLARATHLQQVHVPMLFLQGTRDALAELPLLREALAPLGPLATLHEVDDADHAFHVRKRSGRDDAQVLQELAAAIAGWCRPLAAGPGPL